VTVDSLGNFARNSYGAYNMLVKKITNHLVDIFVDTTNPFPTGFEPNSWLRLQKRPHGWVQVAGVRLPAWQFKKITEQLK